jgi:hypothetical protein
MGFRCRPCQQWSRFALGSTSPEPETALRRAGVRPAWPQPDDPSISIPSISTARIISIPMVRAARPADEWLADYAPEIDNLRAALKLLFGWGGA